MPCPQHTCSMPTPRSTQGTIQTHTMPQWKGGFAPKQMAKRTILWDRHPVSTGKGNPNAWPVMAPSAKGFLASSSPDPGGMRIPAAIMSSTLLFNILIFPTSTATACRCSGLIRKGILTMGELGQEDLLTKTCCRRWHRLRKECTRQQSTGFWDKKEGGRRMFLCTGR